MSPGPKFKNGYVSIESQDAEKESNLNNLSASESTAGISTDYLLNGKSRNHLLNIWRYVSACLNLLLLLLCVLLWTKIQKLSSPLPPWPGAVYSPAQHVIEYETAVFNAGFNNGNGTIYMAPPTNESDAAWEDLWKPTLFAEVSASDASRLPNKSVQLDESNAHYLVGLDVFHQLHCLDSLRQSLRPERYGPDKMTGKDAAVGIAHWDHCIEVIRQNLMCSVDISPVSWHWEPEKGEMRTTTTEHVCRKWGPIKKWADEHVQVHFMNDKKDQQT